MNEIRLDNVDGQYVLANRQKSTLDEIFEKIHEKYKGSSRILTE